MKKSFFLYILILAAVLFSSLTSYAEPAEEAAGPGVYMGSGIGKVPRITAGRAPVAVTEENSAGEAETVTGAGEALDTPAKLEDSVGTVETEVLSGQKSWEERCAADFLLTEMPVPQTGELFHSDKYFSTSASVMINNFGTDDTVIKFSSGTDELVFVAYIRKGEKTTVQIPGGYYRMKQAFGGKWYGTEEMFGNCGRYCECSIDGQSLFNIKRGGKYVISTNGQGDAFSKKEVLKEKF